MTSAQFLTGWRRQRDQVAEFVKFKLWHITWEICLDFLDTVTDNDYLTRAYLPSNRGLTESLYWASWSFSQHQFLAASQLGPPLQLLFPPARFMDSQFKSSIIFLSAHRALLCFLFSPVICEIFPLCPFSWVFFLPLLLRALSLKNLRFTWLFSSSLEFPWVPLSSLEFPWSWARPTPNRYFLLLFYTK